MSENIKTEKSADDDMVKQIDLSPVAEKETDDQYRQRIQLAREMEPMKLTNWFVDCPCVMLTIAFGILILITAAAVSNNWVA